MSNDLKPWGFELEEYIREGEPDRIRRAEAWQTAIGLQDVDGLKVSEYLVDTAKQNIEGRIDSAATQKRLESYYAQRHARGIYEAETEEADIVSQRAAALLMEDGFQFSPTMLMNIHKRLFEGVLMDAGKLRTYNITKAEWVLNGESVQYASFDMIRDSLKYDFEQETNFSYEGVSANEAILHIAQFVSGIWQIHPFSEGNTRTTAIFTIKYLRSKGFNVGNSEFTDSSWYFRNALVRANYDNYLENVHSTVQPLEHFFDNLLLGTHHALKNRYLHVDYQRLAQSENSESAEAGDSKCNNCTLDCTLQELAVLRQLVANPVMTQKELAASLGLSERTIKTRTVELQEKGLLEREGGRRNGKWLVKANLDRVQ